MNLFLVFFLLFGSMAFAETNEEELFATAQRAFDDGFHDVAIRYLEEFLPKYYQSPKIAQARLLLGQCYFFKNDYPKALSLFKGLDNIPEKDLLLFWRGETYLKLSDYSKAQDNYDELLNFFPESPYVPQALYSLGWSHFDQKQYEQARDVFQRLLDRFPKHPLAEDAFLKRAESTYNAGDYSSAIKEFNDYLSLYPHSAKASEVNLNIADAFYYMEDYTQALAYYEKVVKLSQNPQIVQTAYIGRVWCGIKKNMYESAQKWLKEALDLASIKGLSNEDLMLAQGNLFYEKGDNESAVTAFSQLIGQHPAGERRLEAYLGRANAFYALNKFSKAAEDFKFVLDHRRENQDHELMEKAGLGLGWTFVKMGQVSDGIRAFQGVFAQASRTDVKVNALVQMADAYQDAGKLEESIDLYEDIIKTYASSPFIDYVQYRQAIALLKSDKTDTAAAAFEWLQKNYPSSKYSEDINYYLGIVNYKKGDWVSAAKSMEAFLKSLTHPSEFAPEANYILALSFLNLKQNEEALKTFQKILRLYPNDEDVAKNADIGIAKCQFELGQSKEALKRFKLIVYKYPKTNVEQEALLWLAQYAMKNSQYAEAIDSYTQILERFPDSAPADQINYELAQAYEMQGSLDQALVHYKAVSSKDPALYSRVKLAIAGIFSREFDPSKALGAYQNIVSANPEYSRDAYLKMAQLYRNSQDYENEIATYEKAMKTEQGKASVTNAELLFNIGDAYEAAGGVEKALDYYLKVPAQYPQETAWVVKAYLRIATIFEDRKDWEGAKVTYRKIIQLKTDESKYAQERLDWLKKK
jgi:TolA-binding protein